MTPTRSNKKRLLTNQRAFSLVEVTMAMGIIAVAFIPLLGLLSVGFSTMKASNVDVRTALIAQRMLAAAQMLPYGDLSTNSTTNYFDYDGKEVPASEAAFTAAFQPSTNNVLGSPNLRNVTVTLTGSAVENRPRIYASTVVNLGD